MEKDQYEDAARAVHAALRARTKGRRLHIDRYKRHAAEVLQLSAVYPARWNEVIEAGRRMGLFRVDRETLSKPIFVDLCKGTAPAPVEESTFDEDTSDEPTVEVNAGELACEVLPGPNYEPDPVLDGGGCDGFGMVTGDPQQDDCYPGEDINEADMAVLVQYPPGHADHHKGLHVYLDGFFSKNEVADLVRLAKRRGAILIHVTGLLVRAV